MARYLAVVFAVLALAAGGWAISRSKQIARLRSGLAALDAERADLRKKIWAAEKLNRELAAHPGDGAAGSASVAGAPSAATAPEAPVRPGDLSDIPGRVMAFMDNPEIQRLMTLTQRANLDGRFSPLFKNLRLSPADLEKFKNLLVEKQTSVMDVMAAARSQGLTGRENSAELRKLVQESQAEIDNNIRATLGDAAFNQYKTYEQTLPQRTVVNQLGQRLSYTATPLNDQQSEQLVQVLAQNAPPRSPAQTFAGAIGAGNRGGNQITDQAIAQAQDVLSAPQIEAMRQLQQEQQAQAQLAQQMRAGMGGRRTGTANPPPASPPVPPKG
ncbi:MAG: hypothetical protein HY302_15125 [Opitutae bacterium]|nr:hypothetical protein [Opitutae bacterium]